MDMIQVLERILALSTDDGFLHFQHALSRRIYTALGHGYAGAENELSLIERMVDAVNGQSYRGVRVLATIIHGPRSCVKFDFMGKPVTKEVGDMTVVTLVTDGGIRLVQKACLIQSKKERNGHWRIDEEQLYLLKNFPPLSEGKGLFKGCQGLTFRNLSGCLGCYGLLLSPGEMILASAPALTEMLRGKKSLSHADIGVAPGGTGAGWSGLEQPMPWWPGFPCRPPTKVYMALQELVSRYEYPMLARLLLNGFLGCSPFSRDIHDFTRNWTQLNLGEPTAVLGWIPNLAADAFSSFVLRSAGFKDLDVELPTHNLFGDREAEGHTAVMLMHMDISVDE